MKYNDLNELEDIIKKLEQSNVEMENITKNTDLPCNDVRTYDILITMNNKKLNYLKKIRQEYIDWNAQTVGVPTQMKEEL